MAAAPYRTPAFFINRFVGGFQQQPMRVRPGSPNSTTVTLQEDRRPAVSDEQTLRSLVAKFGGAGRFGGSVP
jgi:hypothetical protein